MRHTKHETRTTRHVVALDPPEIETALREYGLRKLAISEMRNSEPAHFQAVIRPDYVAPGQVAGPMSPGSCVQVVFDEVSR